MEEKRNVIVNFTNRDTGFLFAAFAIAGVAFLGYLVLIVRRQSEVAKRLREIRDASHNATQD